MVPSIPHAIFTLVKALCSSLRRPRRSSALYPPSTHHPRALELSVSRCCVTSTASSRACPLGGAPLHDISKPPPPPPPSLCSLRTVYVHAAQKPSSSSSSLVRRPDCSSTTSSKLRSHRPLSRQSKKPRRERQIRHRHRRADPHLMSHGSAAPVKLACRIPSPSHLRPQIGQGTTRRLDAAARQQLFRLQLELRLLFGSTGSAYTCPGPARSHPVPRPCSSKQKHTYRDRLPGHLCRSILSPSSEVITSPSRLVLCSSLDNFPCLPPHLTFCASPPDYSGLLCSSRSIPSLHPLSTQP